MSETAHQLTANSHANRYAGEATIEAELKSFSGENVQAFFTEIQCACESNARSISAIPLRANPASFPELAGQRNVSFQES